MSSGSSRISFGSSILYSCFHMNNFHGTMPRNESIEYLSLEKFCQERLQKSQETKQAAVLPLRPA